MFKDRISGTEILLDLRTGVSSLVMMLLAGLFVACSNNAHSVDQFTGVGSGTDSSTAITSSSLQFVPSAFDFGLVSSTAAAATTTISLNNVSAKPLYISSLSTPTDPNFAAVSSTCPAGLVSLGAHASCAITLSFHPVTSGILVYTMTAQFSETPSTSLMTTSTQVKGTGVLPLSFAGLNPIDPSTVTTTKANLTWPSVPGASSFVINQVSNLGVLSLVGYASGNATSFTVAGLQPSTTYVFRANAVDALGNLDANTVNQSTTTEDIGAFSIVPAFSVLEGQAVTSPALNTYCTDSYGHSPSFMAIANQSDADSGCTLLTNPYRISCQPAYKTGHVNWTSSLTVSCLLNDYPTSFTQTVGVQVTHVDRPPVISIVVNQTVIAGQAIQTVTASATDPNLYSLKYNCNYDNLVDGTVSSGAATCASLLNQAGTNATFASGVFNWTPRLADQGKDFEIKLTADDSHLTSSTIFVIHVVAPPPSPATSTLSLASASVASGQTVLAAVQAKDANGNSLTAGGATVVFSSSGGTSTGTFSATTDHGDGTYSAVFTGVLAGSATTIHASVQGAQITTSLSTLTVTPGVISTARSVLTASSSTVQSGGVIALTLQAKDAQGNALTTGGSAVLFSTSGGTSTGSISATTDQVNGSYTATFTGVTAGTLLTLNATIGGVAVTSTPPTVIVTPGALSLSHSVVTVGSSTVTSGGTIAVLLQAKDANDNNLTSGGLSVTFTQGGGTSAGVIGTVIDNSNGSYSANFLATTAGTATSIGATIGAIAVTSSAPTITVSPGAISATRSLISVSIPTVNSGSSIAVTLQAKDANGNNLVNGGSTLHFSASGGGGARALFRRWWTTVVVLIA